MVRPDQGPYPVPAAAAEKSVLEEGRVLFSAMIYGWSFTYFPGDRSRKVQESFELLPVAQVPWGSRHLSVRETTVEETRLWVRMSYALDDDESLRRSGWESNTAALSTEGGASETWKTAWSASSIRPCMREKEAWVILSRSSAW